MLVLSRKLEEAIRLGDEITIKVLEIRGGQVRLGIEAPRSVNIVRSELISEQPSKREPEDLRQPVAERSKVSAAI